MLLFRDPAIVPEVKRSLPATTHTQVALSILETVLDALVGFRTFGGFIRRDPGNIERWKGTGRPEEPRDIPASALANQHAELRC
jgi:hypothetical protein